MDIPIIYTGLRPGEKLYEELLMDEEGLQDTANRLIHVGRPIDMDDEAFCRQLEVLERPAGTTARTSAAAWRTWCPPITPRKTDRL